MTSRALRALASSRLQGQKHFTNLRLARGCCTCRHHHPLYLPLLACFKPAGLCYRSELTHFACRESIVFAVPPYHISSLILAIAPVACHTHHCLVLSRIHRTWHYGVTLKLCFEIVTLLKASRRNLYFERTVVHRSRFPLRGQWHRVSNKVRASPTHILGACSLFGSIWRALWV